MIQIKSTRVWKFGYYSEVWAAALSWQCCKVWQYFYDKVDGDPNYRFREDGLKGAPRFDPRGLPGKPATHPAHAAVAEICGLVPKRLA